MISVKPNIKKYPMINENVLKLSSAGYGKGNFAIGLKATLIYGLVVVIKCMHGDNFVKWFQENESLMGSIIKNICYKNIMAKKIMGPVSTRIYIGKVSGNNVLGKRAAILGKFFHISSSAELVISIKT